MKIPIPQTNIKIVITTERAINDLVNRLIAEKRRVIYQQGRSDLADIVKAHFADIDLGPNVRRVPVMDMPPYQDKPKEETKAASG